MSRFQDYRGGLLGHAVVPSYVLMTPLNYVTDVWCTDEGGRVRKRLRTTSVTPFESIVSGQGTWPWLLFNVVTLLPSLYLSNIVVV